MRGSGDEEQYVLDFCRSVYRLNEDDIEKVKKALKKSWWKRLLD